MFENQRAFQNARQGNVARFALSQEEKQDKPTEPAPAQIKWRLAAVMADREIDYKQLAEMTGLHRITVSKHKNMKVMPRVLESKTLWLYCNALKCQPGDLLRWMPQEVETDK